MLIACLFDGAGLARLGLEQAGHDVIGFELDPLKHMLSQHVGSGQCVLADVRDVDLSEFDGVWASPPCQERSEARTKGTNIRSPFADDFLDWCLTLPHDPLWVENVIARGVEANEWGTRYNAGQFLWKPVQSRNRIIGGRYKAPKVFRPYSPSMRNTCPAITASEYKGSVTDTRRASRFYGRKLTIEECAYHQGFDIPAAWYDRPDGISQKQWTENLYEAIGNGVPVYMARAFGEAYA